MFGRKKSAAKKEVCISLLRTDKTELLRCPAGEYALPESAVLRLSTEYFNDPEPCEIHRGAVHRRVQMELMERCPAGQAVAIGALDGLTDCFPPEAAFIRVEE